MSDKSFILGANRHGKGRVRLLKLHRNGDRHDFIELTAQVLIEGPNMESAFKASDNTQIVATDTVKNTVYVLAKRYQFNSIEEFAQIIGRHFLTQYRDIVNKCEVKLTRHLYTRVVNKDSRGRVMQHNHAFVKQGPQTTFTTLVATRTGGGINFSIKSGVRDLIVLKTTQTGFENFHQDEYRTLGDVSDRLVGTNVYAEWTFSPQAINSKPDYQAVSKEILDTLVDEFAGPADVGVYSASVQATLYDMGAAVLSKSRLVDKIELYMPNIHNIPFDLSKLGLENKDHTGNPDVFYPTDEPHGMINATVERTRSRL